MKSLSRVLFWWGDVFADSLYACDVCVQLRTAYRDDQGIMVRDVLNVLRSLVPSQGSKKTSVRSFGQASYRARLPTCRVRAGHGKLGKSWNFTISFSRPGKS